MTRKGPKGRQKPSSGLRSASQEFLAFPACLAELAAQLARAGMSQPCRASLRRSLVGFAPNLRAASHGYGTTVRRRWDMDGLKSYLQCAYRIVCAGTLSVPRFAVVFPFLFEISFSFLRMRRSRAWPLSQIQLFFLVSLSLSSYLVCEPIFVSGCRWYL
ncbi:hypothetical protein J3F84DRAFT_389190 [Trichoderma pleuroticola]